MGVPKAVLEVDGEAVFVLEDVVVLEVEMEPVAVRVDFNEMVALLVADPDRDTDLDFNAVLLAVKVLLEVEETVAG